MPRSLPISALPTSVPCSRGPDLFPDDFLTTVERLNLIARQLIHGRRQALRQSVKKGASMEFRDFREYSPGDDPRTVDWLAYARLGQVYVKLFRQEEELDLWVLLDSSRSMDFGSPNKFDHARRIAAALAYIGLANMDSASLLPFDDGVRPAPQSRERLRGRGKTLELLDTLRNLRPDGRTDLTSTVKAFTNRVRRPGLVVILSDFYGLSEALPAIDRLRFQKHQVHVVQLVSPWERDPPLRGELRIVDAESGAHADLTITDSMLRRYRQAFDDHAAALKAHAMKGSVGYDQAPTDQPFDEFLRRVLQSGRLLG